MTSVSLKTEAIGSFETSETSYSLTRQQMAEEENTSSYGSGNRTTPMSSLPNLPNKRRASWQNDVKWISIRTFHNYWPIWVKFCMYDLHVIPLGSYKFYKIRYCENQTCTFIRKFNIYYPIYMKLGDENLLKNLFRTCDFRENRHRKGRTFLMRFN